MTFLLNFVPLSGTNSSHGPDDRTGLHTIAGLVLPHVVRILCRLGFTVDGDGGDWGIRGFFGKADELGLKIVLRELNFGSASHKVR